MADIYGFSRVLLLAMGFAFLNGAPPIVCKLVFVFMCGFEVVGWVYTRSEFHFDAGRARRDMEKLLGEAVDIDWNESE